MGFIASGANGIGTLMGLKVTRQFILRKVNFEGFELDHCESLGQCREYRGILSEQIKTQTCLARLRVFRSSALELSRM